MMGHDLSTSSEVTSDITRQFIDLKLRPLTMFFYVPRTAILRAVSEAAPVFSGRVLDIGCGFMPYRSLVESNEQVDSYIGVDLEGSAIYGSVKPNMTWDGKNIPVDDGSADCVIATEFLEHHSQPSEILNEFHRVLKPDGILFGTVPFLWNLHEIPHDEYRYTPYAVERMLADAGFADIEIKGLGGWNASMAQMIGLWITFARLPRFVRGVLRLALFPIFALLVKTDRRPELFDDSENSMFIGLSFTARKRK